MAGARPFRKELVLSRDIRQTLLDLGIDRRIDKVQEREKGTESIPESGVGVEISVTYFSIVRTVMDNVSVFIYFIELAREEDAPVKA